MPLIENYLVSYREVEFTETSLIANPWYDSINVLLGSLISIGIIDIVDHWTIVILWLESYEYPLKLE